jgi:MarR family transcriptional regulator, temperature-dependent positive regulator of motility
MGSEQTNDILEMSPVHLLHRAGQFAGDVFVSEMGDDGLTPRQYAVLVAVAESEGLSQTDLVGRTGVDRSTLADIVRRMIKKGLISRQRTKRDARAYSVKLTDRGRKALDSARPAARSADERVLATLSPKQRQAFVDVLSTLVRAIGEKPPTDD